MVEQSGENSVRSDLESANKRSKEKSANIGERRITESEPSKSSQATKMSVLCQIEPFKKSDDWPSFVLQLETFTLLNDLADNKKAALLLTRLSTEVFAEL